MFGECDKDQMTRITGKHVLSKFCYSQRFNILILFKPEWMAVNVIFSYPPYKKSSLSCKKSKNTWKITRPILSLIFTFRTTFVLIRIVRVLIILFF